jgi:restriction endonuclease S subunit
MTGGTPTSSNKAYYENGEIPWLVSGDIHKAAIFDCDARITAEGMENSNAKILPKDSVLIALNGQGKTRGTVALLRMPKATCNQSLVSMNPISKEQLLPEFLFHQLRGMYSQIRDITGDNERSGLSISIIKTIQIVLPPLVEQQQIVKLLDESAAMRKLRGQADRRAADLIPALFHQMFGDPATNPKAWQTAQLGESLEISRERIEPGKHPEAVFNYVGLENIEGHTGKLLPYHPTQGAKIKSTKNIFHRGEILFGKLRPNLNKVHLAGDEGICSTDIFVLRPCNEKLHPEFATNYLRSPAVLSFVSGAMSGANLPRISQETLHRIEIPLPPLTLQTQFAQRVTEIRAMESAQATSRTHLDALYQSMLHRAFNGEL